jgi:hypothetical protein
MRKNLLLLVFAIAMQTAMGQETLTGWNFPVNSGADSLNANLGTTQDKGYDLRFQLFLTPTSDSTINSIYFVDGPATYAAATAGWQDGANVRFWSIKFKAANYSNFKVTSKQKSVDGPRDFKIQWRISSTTYEDVTGGAVTLANDWTTGVVDQLPVPVIGQGTSSIYIRWLMNSNIDVNGGTVASNGVSMIDDILVTGTTSQGVDEVLYTNRISVFPSPNQGVFTVKSTQPLSSIVVTDENGKIIYSENHPGMSSDIGLKGTAKGVYFLRVRFADNDKDCTQKFIIR